ncbi:transposase [bacterium]|nr:MAG: transposase [bacterium]
MTVALKVRLYPTKAQRFLLEEMLETCRRLYNNFLAQRKETYEATGKSPSKFDQIKSLTGTKNEWQLRVHSQVLQNVATRVQLAFDGFFRRVKSGETPGYPRFKGRGYYDSFTYPQSGFELQESAVKLSKIGVVNAIVHRQVEGKLKTCTLRRQNAKWFACLVIETEDQPLEPTGESVGIDVGLESFATLSTGEKVENPRLYRLDEKALAKAQRRLSKAEKGAKARRKARKVVARIHERIRNRRHNFVHQTARKIVNLFDMIAVEDLNVSALQKNHCLAKSIPDASWTMFRIVLAHKAESAGRRFVAVNPAYTSQDCSRCGTREKKTLSQRTHQCVHCGLVLDRDHNAALNILALGTQCLQVDT